MNKLSKIGCSALCGSLAAISSANAGDMTVTGGVDMSWISLDQNSTTGNPIGMGSNLTFKGSGELDNGWTFDLTVANLNASAYSSTAVKLDMGSLGVLNFNSGDSGNGIDAYDDKMPTAWEEPWGAGVDAGIKLVSGVGPSANVQYTTPTFAGTTVAVAVAPVKGATDTGDKAGSGVNASGYGAAYDATININPSFGTEVLSGLNMFVGGHYTESYTAADNNLYEGVAGITFDIGPISLGGGRQGHWTGKTTTGTNTDFYRNSHYGIAFNINDDLSLSYGFHESRQHPVNPGSNAGVTTDVSSYQIAYTMGGASFRYAEVDVGNANYIRNRSRGGKIVSVSLAF